MAYLELETYSEPWYIQNPRHIKKHCQTSTTERFAKNSYLAHSLSPSFKNKKKFLYVFIFREMELSSSIIFSKESFSYFFTKRKTPKKVLVFQETELFYISRNLLFFRE